MNPEQALQSLLPLVGGQNNISRVSQRDESVYILSLIHI